MTNLRDNHGFLPIEKYNWTTQDVADKLGFHVNHICAMAKTGQLPCIKTGRKWRFAEEEIMEYIRGLTKDAHQTPKRKIDESDTAPEGEVGDIDISDLIR